MFLRVLCSYLRVRRLSKLCDYVTTLNRLQQFLRTRYNLCKIFAIHFPCFKEVLVPAYVEYEFPKKFDLDEEKLRRIVEILKERIPADGHQKIFFQVSRRDSLIYKTEKISTILNEDNDSTKIINTITITYHEDNLKALITFDADKGCKISIEGEDRDLVFLLASSLKEYIGKEVTIYFKLPFSGKIIPSLIILGFGFYWMYLIYPSLAIETNLNYQEVVKSQNINDKLNYLILKGK